MSDLDLLSELQLDAVTEIVNIGMGQAADALSTMLGEEILLSVPRLVFYRRAQAIEHLREQVASSLSGVRQRFEGGLAGDALLLFPEDKSLEIVRLLLRDTVPTEDLTEFEQEALCEIGNIILNAGIGSMGDAFQVSMESSLPSFQAGDIAGIVGAGEADEQGIVMLLRVDFDVRHHEIRGYVLYVLDVDGLDALKANIDAFLAGALGG